MGVECEKPGGVGQRCYTAMGGYFKHRVASMHTITHPCPTQAVQAVCKWAFVCK